MIYFNGINNLKQAKLRYRRLAKQLHPDTGGTAQEFQKLQEEYNTLALKFQRKSVPVKKQPQYFSVNELLDDLEKIAKLLLKKQVPQTYIKQKIKITDSSLKKGMLEGIVSFLDGL